MSSGGYTERCPWCNSSITRTKFLEIETKIREQERQKAAEAEATIKKRLEEKYRLDLSKAVRSAEQKAREETEKKIKSVAADRDRAIEKANAAAAREAGIKKQAEQEYEKKLCLIRQESERRQQVEIANVRQLLQKHSDLELLKQNSQFNREREKYQKKVKDLERQLERKTAHELGDGAEIDVYESLREAFPDDEINRVPKGTPGADIEHDIKYKGDRCGKIVYDTKNRQGWQYSYVTKLREDQLTAKADHAILPTSVFPSSKKELCIESGVIVVNPNRVVELVGLLRNAMIRMHVLGLTAKQRSGKMNSLYGFITSEAYSQRTAEASRITGNLLQLDVDEQKDHQKIWKQRGQLVTRIKNILREVDAEIAAILEEEDEDDLKKAS